MDPNATLTTDYGTSVEGNVIGSDYSSVMAQGTIGSVVADDEIAIDFKNMMGSGEEGSDDLMGGCGCGASCSCADCKCLSGEPNDGSLGGGDLMDEMISGVMENLSMPTGSLDPIARGLFDLIESFNTLSDAVADRLSSLSAAGDASGEETASDEDMMSSEKMSTGKSSGLAGSDSGDSDQDVMSSKKVTRSMVDDDMDSDAMLSESKAKTGGSKSSFSDADSRDFIRALSRLFRK